MLILIGQMLAGSSAVQGSAGYVAMERVNGTPHGLTGAFALHIGVMTRGTPQLSMTVAPDSGTDELVGLAGRMTVNIRCKLLQWSALVGARGAGRL